MASLHNTRTGACLASRLEVAASFWAKVKGLLGRSGLDPGAGLYIVPCNSIHSFFMRFPFDAVFVDKHWRVVHLINNMPPFRASRLVFRGHGVVELPAGTIRATGTGNGDILQLR